MDKLCKQYIKDAKALFPVMGKSEKIFIRKLEYNLRDYCEELTVSSMDGIYKNFGTPAEVVNAYFSSANIDYILKQIKRTRAIKAVLVALVVVALIAVTTYCSILYSTFEVFKAEQIFSEDTFIE